ncbi:MAG: endonuclease, TnsA family [Rhodocyclales bacterium]|nr:endonuclease, TnsA family [Rhodocyclales bacterium]
MATLNRDEEWISELLGGLENIRRKVGPSAFSSPGRISTAKAEQAQDAESLLERDFLHLLEYDFRVERVATQPFSLPWVSPRGRVEPYTPDVLVKYSRKALAAEPHLRHTVFEVKPASIIRRDWKKLKPKWIAAICWCKQFDLRFRVVTEARIRVPELKNIQFLRRFRSVCIGGSEPTACETKKAILHALERLGTTTPRELLNSLSDNPQRQAETVPWLWQLVGEGCVQVDMTVPLTMAVSIWPLEPILNPVNHRHQT